MSYAYTSEYTDKYASAAAYAKNIVAPTVSSSYIDSLPEAMKNILYDLRILSRLQRGETLSTMNEFLDIEVRGTLTSAISRTYARDNHARILPRISRSIDTLITFVDLIKDSKHLQLNGDKIISAEEMFEHDKRMAWLTEFRNVCLLAIPGIMNLVVTYAHEDSGFCIRLQNIVTRLYAYTNGITNYLHVAEKKRHDYMQKIYRASDSDGMDVDNESREFPIAKVIRDAMASDSPPPSSSPSDSSDDGMY